MSPRRRQAPAAPEQAAELVAVRVRGSHEAANALLGLLRDLPRVAVLSLSRPYERDGGVVDLYVHAILRDSNGDGAA